MLKTYPQEDFTCALVYVRTKALDVSGDAVAIYTAAERVVASTIVYANDALAKLSGFDLAHFVGHSALLLAGARPDPSAIAAVLPRAGERALLATVRKYRPGGSVYQVEVLVAPLRSDAGVVTHYLSRQRLVGPTAAPTVRRTMRSSTTPQVPSSAPVAAGQAR